MFLLFALFLSSISASANVRIQLWHQMIYSHREVLAEAVREFERAHPGVNVDVTYRETEELRSAYQAAAMAGSGPELIYGPGDQVGPFATMGIIRPLDDVLFGTDLADFDPLGIVHYKNKIFMLSNTVGNHVMLIYNRKFVEKPPRTTDELIEFGEAQKRAGRYGLVWNFTEPFFFVPWVSGFGEPFVTPAGLPNLDTHAMRDALKFVLGLRARGIAPRECDYEEANALFKEGKAAMIVNGDWSWGDYIKAGIPIGVARMPRVFSTGKWPAPLVSARGYSLNKNIEPEKLPIALELLKYLTGRETQLLFAKRVNAMPSRVSVRKDPIVVNNSLLRDSAEVIKIGDPMPVAPEIRAVWDSLRAELQAVFAGSENPELAGPRAQISAEEQIKNMNQVLKPGPQAIFLEIVFVALLILFFWKLWRAWPAILAEFRGPHRFAQLMMLPGFLGIFLVVVYPFFYNIVISVSNLSLRTFDNWQIVGFQHYTHVLSDPFFYGVLGKTLLWSVVNLVGHVAIGLSLALLLDEVLPARPLFRTILIIPWAIPQYITALTWRGMFNQEYGAINLVLAKFLHMQPIEWLSRPLEAFAACMLTNVWLGFPFMMVVALGGLQSIPKQLYEAARVDGANAFQRFRNVTWPLLQPVMIPAMTLGFIWTFNNLNVIWLVSNGGEPGDSTHILVSYVYKAAFNFYRYGYSAALSMINFLILLGFAVYYLRLMARRQNA